MTVSAVFWRRLILICGTIVKAAAMYPYVAGNPDELSFEEGDVLAIVDRSEHDWWKVEKDGKIYVVPAAYLEVVDG